MLTQYKKSWMLLVTFAGCAGLATTGFAGEPQARVAEVQPGENAQSIYLIKLLEGSSQFRVRAQAAISLGMIERSPAAREALTAALHDEHPAVRTAAATSLGRLGDSNHVVALRALGSDPEAPVRNAARASIGRIERMIEVPALERDAALTTAVLAAATSVQRM
jgi:HEAT repeat protein